MGQFKLLSGRFIGPDLSKKPDEKTGRRPSKTWLMNQVVESDKDLVQIHGTAKFAYHGDQQQQPARMRAVGEPPPEVAETDPAVFPGGQVSTGFQQATGGVHPASAPISRSELEQRDLLPTHDDEPARSQESHHQFQVPSKPAHGEQEDLDGLTVEELRQLARERDITLGSARNKDEILKTIRSKQTGK